MCPAAVVVPLYLLPLCTRCRQVEVLCTSFETSFPRKVCTFRMTSLSQRRCGSVCVCTCACVCVCAQRICMSEQGSSEHSTMSVCLSACTDCVGSRKGEVDQQGSRRRGTFFILHDVYVRVLLTPSACCCRVQMPPLPHPLTCSCRACSSNSQ